MAMGGQAPLPEPPFSISNQSPAPHLPPADLTGGPWALFTSRHEQLQSSVPSSSSTAIHAPYLIIVPDSEAEAVESFALQHVASDSDEEAARASPRHMPASKTMLYVCNGPWSALHRPTPVSITEYESMQVPSAFVLKPKCGARLGPAATALRLQPFQPLHTEWMRLKSAWH